MAEIKTGDGSPRDTIIFLFIFALVGNIFATAVIKAASDQFGSGFVVALLLLVLFGFQTAQTCLIAVWAALGNQSFLGRCFCCTLVLVSLFAEHILTLVVMRANSGIVILLSGSAQVAVFGCVILPLIVYRTRWRRVLATRKDIPTARFLRFSIRHVLIFTSIVAAATIAIKTVAAAYLRAYSSPVAPGFPAIAFAFCFIVPIALITILCVQWMFTKHGAYGRALLATLLISPVIPTAIISFLVSTGFGPVEEALFVWLFTFIFLGSLATAIVAVFAVFREIDFRLQHLVETPHEIGS